MQLKAQPQSPIPEWTAERWVIVDPAVWPSFYTGSGCDLRPVYRHLLQAFKSLQVEVTKLRTADHPLDIWIRDWGSVAGHYFIFRPRYARSLYPETAVSRARLGLNQRVSQEPLRVALVLDGGNLVHDGSTAIVTDRVLRDNPKFSRAQIIRTITACGFRDVVVIPAEPDDPLGHADGVIKFLPGDILLLNDYRGTPLEDYGRAVGRILRRSLKHKRLILIPFRFTEERHDELYSAVGVFVNLIATKHGLILPAFGCSLDVHACEILEEAVGLPVRSVPATALARLGGGLGCITLPI